MTLKDFVEKYKVDFNKDVLNDFEFLILETLRIDKLDLVTGSKSLNIKELELLQQRMHLLKSGMPLSYILNSHMFYGYDLYVDEGVLIPRSETEYLMEYCLKNTDSSFINVLDAGAGSGCIGITYLLERPNSKCVFIENSLSAIDVLKKNLDKNNIHLNRYLIVHSFEEYEKSSFFKNQIDLFISNPPYISFDDIRVDKNVLKYEPHQALFATDNGLLYLKEWSLKALQYLDKKGFAIFEFGLGQEEDLKIFAKDNHIDSEFILDQYRDKRFWKIRI